MTLPLFFFLFYLLCSLNPTPLWAKSFFHHAKSDKKLASPSEDKLLGEYINYFKSVFEIIQANYYTKPDQAQFDAFVAKFKAKIYPALKAEGKSQDYVKWRATWYMVDGLKTPQDKFSQFYPPKPAQEFQHEALGQRVDLGIEGKKEGEVFLVTRLEPHADAYGVGLREMDRLVEIDGQAVSTMNEDKIKNALNPIINTQVRLRYISNETQTQKEVIVKSQEYFKQTVFLSPVSVEGVYCIEIPKFNRLTGEDLYRFLKFIKGRQPRGLILDLRGNPGGPPLAAREVAGFFLKGNQEFAHFQRRDQPISPLDIPEYDSELKYDGPLVILVNGESGSAAELITGIMQYQKRALVLGEETAGQVLLKSMFPVGDGAMVALVTGLGYYPDGKTFGFNGIKPDKIVTDAPKQGLIDLAAALILYTQKGLQ